jgi:dephospho-CoA kinase
MKIIGITGTIGAGKGEVAEYLKGKGFAYFSVREFLFEEIRRRGLPENRDSTNMVGEELRQKHGASYIHEQLYARAEKMGKDAILDSVRTVGEVRFLRTKPDFLLLAVDADPKIRYARALGRKSALDHVTFEKFMADEKRESIGDDPAKMNLPDCIKLADVVIMNEGTKEELYRKVEEFLNKK